MESNNLVKNNQKNFGGLNPVNLGELLNVTVISDTHYTPPEIVKAILPLLGGKMSSHIPDINTPFFKKIMNGPEDGDESAIMVGLGDIWHLTPLLPWQSALTDTAMHLFADLIARQHVPGHFKWIPGNHDPIDKIPQEIQEYLTEEEILIPGGITFNQKGKHFFAMHGDIFQPGFHNIPFENNPHIVGIFDQVINLFRKISPHNGPNEPYYPYSKGINRFFNLFALKWKKANLPEEIHLITGHTHVPIIDEEERYYNPGLRDILLKCSSCLKIENGIETLEFQEI